MMEFIIMIVVMVGIMSFVQWKLERDEKKVEKIEIDGGLLKTKRKTARKRKVKRKAVKKKVARKISKRSKK